MFTTRRDNVGQFDSWRVGSINPQMIRQERHVEAYVKHKRGCRKPRVPSRQLDGDGTSDRADSPQIPIPERQQFENIAAVPLERVPAPLAEQPGQLEAFDLQQHGATPGQQGAQWGPQHIQGAQPEHRQQVHRQVETSRRQGNAGQFRTVVLSEFVVGPVVVDFPIENITGDRERYKRVVESGTINRDNRRRVRGGVRSDASLVCADFIS